MNIRPIQDNDLDELAQIYTQTYTFFDVGERWTKEKARDILSALHDGDANDKDLKKAVNDVNKAISHLKAYLAKPTPAKKPSK